MPRERLLDPKAVETAEGLRQRNQVVQAAQFATDALGELTQDRIAQIAVSREQVAVLACLARIQVDSFKTIARQARTPGKMLTALESAAGTIETVYRNPVVTSALQGEDVDHLGRPHHFLAEMPRDVAKTDFAAMPLYGDDQATSLFLVGERLLLNTYNSLHDGHPTKPLIGIELQLARAARGADIDKERLLDDFAHLREHDKENNPHRYTTVASWISIWGERIGDPEIREIGAKEFNSMAREHPEWGNLAGDERLRLDTQRSQERWQRTASGLLAPLIDSGRKETLFHTLVHEAPTDR